MDEDEERLLRDQVWLIREALRRGYMDSGRGGSVNWGLDRFRSRSV